MQQYTFYDQYDFVSALNTNLSFDATNAYHSKHSSAKGLPTGSVSYNQADHNQYFMSAQYHDTKNRPIQSFTTHTLSPTQPNRKDFQYNFAGEVLKERVFGRFTNENITLITDFDRNHVGLITNTYLTINGGIKEKISTQTYDAINRLLQKTILPDGTFTAGGFQDYINRSTSPASALVDIAKKAICLLPGVLIDGSNIPYSATINPNGAGGTTINGLQKMDYLYHIRGGLRGINLDANQNPTPNAAQGDLFSYKLDYETAPTPQWNGNIGKQSWKANDELRSYSFNYDHSSRLKSASFVGIDSENYSLPNINYDDNGNVLNLQRNGLLASNSYGQMDNLTYSYSGNRLNSVTDAVSGNHEVDFVPRGNNAYTYYSNGNLKSDANEQISNIDYNTFLNQPKLLTLADGRTITAAYDGGGNLQKTSYSNGETWHYVDGFVIKNGQLYSINIPDGRLIKNASGGWDKEFNYSDHLGNSRVSFKAENGALVQTAKTDFDPWGIILRSSVSNSVSNRFEMQGKESEKTFGLNRTNFGFRSYNPTIGRWDRVDILSEKYSNMSTYQYCANNPLRYIDPDGMQIDPASQSEWDKQKDAVTNQRDRLQGRIDKLTAKAENKGWSAEKLAGKVGNLSERVSSLNGSLSTLSTLESSKQVYSLSASSGEVGGTALDPSTGNIQISYSGTSNFVHEATHAGQFESGDIAFDKKSGMTYGHDLGDEISAYKAQFAYDPTSISGLRSTSSPNSFGGINSSWVQGISTSTGSQPYTQHGLIPVNMSTTRDALIQAYPQAASGLKNMPSNYSLKSVPTIFYKR